MDASTVKEESLSEEPEHEPSVIDTSSRPNVLYHTLVGSES
jgi:hypothetical protein